MKLIVLLLILWIGALNAFAQKVLAWEPKEINPANMPVDEQGEIRFRELVFLPNTASSTILRRAYDWAITSYPPANSTIQRTKNRLVINGAKKILVDALIGHRLILEVKRGQYEVTVDSLHYIFNLNFSGVASPVKVIRTMPIHSYGASADDFYAFYQFVGSQSDARKADGANSKRMATTYSNQQGQALKEIKQMIESLLVSLKGNIESKSNQ